MATIPTPSFRANGYDILLVRTRSGRQRRPVISEKVADRLALIKTFINIAAKNAKFELRGVRFVLTPGLLTRPYQLKFDEALISYCGLLMESVIEASEIFADNENVTRLAKVSPADRADRFQGVEIRFGLERGQVTLQYLLVDETERKIGHPKAILA